VKINTKEIVRARPEWVNGNKSLICNKNHMMSGGKPCKCHGFKADIVDVNKRKIYTAINISLQ
jgi:hypothetical protein